MERKKYTAVILFLLLLSALSMQLTTPQLTYKEQFYKAFIRGNMVKWLSLMESFEVTEKNKSDKNRFELLNYYYGYTAWLVSRKRVDEAELYIEKSEKLINYLSQKYKNNATLLAYRGAFIAFRIGICKRKAITLGPKGMKCIDDALAINSENAQALIEKGNSLFYMPAAFGGDKKYAILYYRKAVKSMEMNLETTHDWNYLNLLTALGMAYEATNQIQNAKIVYEKIIGMEDNYMWVGEELYPDMCKRHNLEMKYSCEKKDK